MNQNSSSFEEGVRHALETLREVYGDGIEDTDLWGEYMEEEAN